MECTFWKVRNQFVSRQRLKCDGTHAETRSRLSAKGMSPFKSAGASVQSTTGSRGVRISGSNAGSTTFRGSVRVLATRSIRQFPLHFPSPASPCAITFQLDASTVHFFYHSLEHICAGCSKKGNTLYLDNSMLQNVIAFYTWHDYGQMHLFKQPNNVKDYI
jgi:hypothetical protein